jgi:hypothetical protein
MAITVPLALASLADLLPVERVEWNPLYQEEMSSIGSGEFLTADAAPVLWEAVVSLTRVHLDQGEQIAARFRALDGSKQHFYLYNPAMRFPQSDPDGTTLGASSVSINAINANRKAVRLTGLPVGYVITLADYMQVNYGSPSRTALLQAMEGATADGSGLTPEFEVRPHLRAGITTTLAVILKNPAAKVKLLPNSLRTVASDGVFIRQQFTARQTLAAG